MYEYGWASGGPSPGSSSGYYVGILQYNSTKGLGYFLTTQYTNNPNLSGYYDYYYSGSAYGGSDYYFLEDTDGTIQEDNGNGEPNYFPFMPLDQQKNKNYYQYGVFWLYNWFQEENNAENSNNMNIFFLMNGNIFNYSLASVPYSWKGRGSFGCSTYSAYAIPPAPPGNISTITGEPIFVQSYINAYNTAFNQETTSFSENYQTALNKYNRFTSSDVNSNFIIGTFGYKETYNSNEVSFYIGKLIDNFNNYIGTPYLFVSAGSGGGSGFMYLNWVIVTYGVPYVASV